MTAQHTFTATTRHIKPSELTTDLNLTLHEITVIDTPCMIERAKAAGLQQAKAWQLVKPAGQSLWRIIVTSQNYHKASRICRRLNRDPHKPFHYGIDPVYSLATVMAKLNSCIERALEDLWVEAAIETDIEEFEDWTATIPEMKVELDHGVCVVWVLGWMIFLQTIAPDRVEVYWRWSPSDLASPEKDSMPDEDEEE